jgi:CubicO group peptidase (beta-lactamase class C family)
MHSPLLPERTPSQPMYLMLFFIIVLIAAPSALAATQQYPGKTWTKVKTPEALGWSAEALKLARQYSESIGSAAVMLIVQGEILEEWGATTQKWDVASMMKNFMNALYGIAVRDGKIDIQSTLAEVHIDDTEPSLTPVEQQARIADLLQARSGVYHASSADTPAMQKGKPPRGSHPPGTFWYYHNWDFCALGGIYEQAAHASLFEDFHRLIAQPLEMEDFHLADTQYRRGPESRYPWYAFRMSARDLARFGLLYVRQGEWQGQQLIPRQWIADSLKPYSDASSWGRGGYGMLWWVTVHHRLFPNVEVSEQAFAGTGLGGHYLVMIPDLDLVVVHRTNTDVPQPRINDKQFGTLLKMILDARMHD